MSKIVLDTDTARSAAMEGLAVNIRNQIREALCKDKADSTTSKIPPHIGMHTHMNFLLGDGLDYKILPDFTGVIIADFEDFEIVIGTDGSAAVGMCWQAQGYETANMRFTRDEELQLRVYTHRYIETEADACEDPAYGEFVKRLNVNAKNWFK